MAEVVVQGITGGTDFLYRMNLLIQDGRQQRSDKLDEAQQKASQVSDAVRETALQIQQSKVAASRLDVYV